MPAAACRRCHRGDAGRAPRPRSHVGDVLLFEEVLGPRTGAPEDADRTRRCVVRLTRVHHTDRFGHALTDPVSVPTPNAQITGIEWDAADALPFALCISSTTDAAHGARRDRRCQRRARQHGAGRPWTVDRRLPGAGHGAGCAAGAGRTGWRLLCGDRPVVASAAGFLPGAAVPRRSPSRRPYDPTAPASALTRPAASRCTAAAAADHGARRPAATSGRPRPTCSGSIELQRGFVRRDRARRHRLSCASATASTARRRAPAMCSGHATASATAASAMSAAIRSAMCSPPTRASAVGAQSAARRVAAATPRRWSRSASARPGRSARSFAR